MKLKKRLQRHLAEREKEIRSLRSELTLLRWATRVARYHTEFSLQWPVSRVSAKQQWWERAGPLPRADMPFRRDKN